MYALLHLNKYWFFLPKVVVRDRVYEKCLNALEQVKSRKGQPILICEENDQKTISFVPAHGQYIEVSIQQQTKTLLLRLF